MLASCGGKPSDDQRKEVIAKETRPRTDATKKTGMLEERVRKRQRNGSDNTTDVVDDGRGGGMSTPSWVVGGGNGEGGNVWHRGGLGGGTCEM